MSPNWASGPQNHPIEKVAVSVAAGAAASMGGIMCSVEELCCANFIVLLSCIVPALVLFPCTMFHAGRFHGLKKSAHPTLAIPISFINERLLSAVGSSVVVFDAFLQRISFLLNASSVQKCPYVRSDRGILILLFSVNSLWSC
jgi:uncharacterized membrane protein YhaH (DUF805 family)